MRALPRLSGERHNVCEGRDGEGEIGRHKEKGRGGDRQSLGERKRAREREGE